MELNNSISNFEINNHKLTKSDFEKIEYKTKEEIDDILFFKKVSYFRYLISECKKSGNNDNYNKLLVGLYELNLEEQYSFIDNLIYEGEEIAIDLFKELKLDGNQFQINSFYHGIINTDILFSDKIIEYLIVSDRVEIISNYLYKSGFLYEFYIIKELLNLPKVNNNEIRKVIDNFKKQNSIGGLEYKIENYGRYDREEIFNSIFEDSNYAINNLEEIFKLNNKEKIEFKQTRKYFRELFNYDIDTITEEFENSGYDFKKSININNENQLNKKELDKFLNIFLSEKNHGNNLVVSFVDIAGKNINLTLTNSFDILRNQEYSYYNLNDFIESYNNILDNYLNYLEMNDFDFNVLFFKTTGFKDTNNTDIFLEKAA